ncbi:helix-turn-helix domain-containing protein [Microbacterium sp. VKM Ac-2923]|uniref:winged helix-turn-helix transcriptional regulator n=1 Tax=Microbacterium sp. VKM Ac-2923 TaxID=2929476 RepID=UPI001FB4C57C|nr:helix-turn-helix domain-containing protein [Microbacterium sp. VKM Ac-2923]MCJ1707098.1 helix-turn-helix transcriptional regulator [Microbacterium sp. VKM Ac-2923]
MAARNYGQYCGVTTAVELIGERWALLIVRDLLVGARRYTDLKRGLPRIPTNILAARLKEMQDSGIVRRAPFTGRGPIYELTPYGRALEPVVLALGRWGFAAMREPDEGDVITPDSLTMALRTAFQPDAAARLPPMDYEVHVADVALRVRVAEGRLDVVPLAPALPPVGGDLPDGEPDLVFAAGPGIREVIAGSLTPAAAVESGVIRVLAGEASLLDLFARTFHIEITASPEIDTPAVPA